MNANEMEMTYFSAAVWLVCKFHYLRPELRYTGDASVTVRALALAKAENCGIPFEEEWNDSDRLCRRTSVASSFPVAHSSPSAGSYAARSSVGNACIYSVAIHCSNVSSNLSRYFKCIRAFGFAIAVVCQVSFLRCNKLWANVHLQTLPP